VYTTNTLKTTEFQTDVWNCHC